MPAMLSRRCADESDTLRLGAALGAALRAQGLPPLLVTLQGDLGSGKTTLVRSLLQSLGVRGRIKSPTYALVEPYKLSVDGLEFKRSVQTTAYHLDLYRFSSPDEWLDAGLGDVLDGHSLCFVEWPERAAGLPAPDLDIRITTHDGVRDVVIRAGSAAGAAVIDGMASAATDA